jgi:hypothetical protein
VWSRVGRFVEGLHIVGDIITNISANCVINLHDALLFMCSFLWVYPMHGYNYLYVIEYCLYMLHVYLHYYFNMNPECICLFKFHI